MGTVIKINAYGEWERTYFVQDCDEDSAMEKAYKMFKQTMSCYMPETLENVKQDNGIYIEVLARVEQIIL